jgi:hypothetical protein
MSVSLATVAFGVAHGAETRKIVRARPTYTLDIQAEGYGGLDSLNAMLLEGTSLNRSAEQLFEQATAFTYSETHAHLYCNFKQRKSILEACALKLLISKLNVVSHKFVHFEFLQCPFCQCSERTPAHE